MCYRSLGGGQDRWFNEIFIDLGPFPDSDDTPDGPTAVETHVNGGNFRALPNSQHVNNSFCNKLACECCAAYRTAGLSDSFLHKDCHRFPGSHRTQRNRRIRDSSTTKNDRSSQNARVRRHGQQRRPSDREWLSRTESRAFVERNETSTNDQIEPILHDSVSQEPTPLRIPVKPESFIVFAKMFSSGRKTDSVDLSRPDAYRSWHDHHSNARIRSEVCERARKYWVAQTAPRTCCRWSDASLPNR